MRREVQFTLPTQEGRATKALTLVEEYWQQLPEVPERQERESRRSTGTEKKIQRVWVRLKFVCLTCRGLVRAGEEEEEAVLPTASEEGQAEPCDSSLWCCSGDRLSLLLSSSKA